MASFIGRRRFLATLGGSAVVWPLPAGLESPQSACRTYTNGQRSKEFSQLLEATW
jgi:hypothetical protein